MKCNLDEHRHSTTHPSQSWVLNKPNKASKPYPCKISSQLFRSPSKTDDTNCTYTQCKNIISLRHLTWIFWERYRIMQVLFPYSTIRPQEFAYYQKERKNRLIEAGEISWESLLEQGSLVFVLLHPLFLWLLSKARYQTTLHSEPFIVNLTFWCLNMMKEKKNHKREVITVKGKLALTTTMGIFQLHVTLLGLDKVFFGHVDQLFPPSL